MTPTAHDAAPGTGAGTGTAVGVGLLVLYLLSVLCAAVLLWTPSSDPLWAAAALVVGALLLANVGNLLRFRRRRSTDALAGEDAGFTGILAGVVGCALLLGVGIRGHQSALLLSALPVAVLCAAAGPLLARLRR